MVWWFGWSGGLRIFADLFWGKKKKEKSVETEDQEWREKYGEEGARIIRETVNANLADYEYLKSFAIKVPMKE